MAGTSWGWTHDRVDEVASGITKPSPNDWLVGGAALDVGRGAERAQALQDGDQVGFMEMIDHGNGRLLLESDGTWSVDRDMPAGANLVRVMEGVPPGDCSIDTVADAAGLLKDAVAEPGIYPLRYSEVSPLRTMRFDAASKRFVPVPYLN